MKRLQAADERLRGPWLAVVELEHQLRVARRSEAGGAKNGESAAMRTALLEYFSRFSTKVRPAPQH